MTTISARHIKAWQKFNDELRAFIAETENDSVLAEATLYEDQYTTRSVRDFIMTPSGNLTWVEEGVMQKEKMLDEDDAKEWLKFWRANFRRAKRYWAMDAETLDAMADGIIEDKED